MPQKNQKKFHFSKKIILYVSIFLALSISLIYLFNSRFAADTVNVASLEEAGGIKSSVRVIDKTTSNGVANVYVTAKPVSTAGANTNVITGKTGGEGYTNEVDLWLLKNASTGNYYVSKEISEKKIYDAFYFYISNSGGDKIGDQVLLNVNPLTADQLTKKTSDSWFFPTVTLYSDKSGGMVGTPSSSTGTSSPTQTPSTNPSSGTSTPNGVDVGVEIPGHGTHFAGYNSYVSAILDFATKIGFALASLMIIYAGIKYLTSQGNQTAINDAKEILIGAIIGFVLLLLVDVVLKILKVT